jgi:ribosomal-protein-alanine N-acetyltransferase
MKAPSSILTPRLILSRPRPSDAAEIFETYARDPEVTRFLGWRRHESVAETSAFLEFSDGEWERWPAGPYLIRSRDDGRLLGGTGLGFEAGDQAVTGYVLAQGAWGRGYATEALTAMIDVARRAGVLTLYALCHPQHRASWHVLEKCGFTRDGDWSQQAEFPNLAPGVLQDVLRYTLTLHGLHVPDDDPSNGWEAAPGCGPGVDEHVDEGESHDYDAQKMAAD